MTTNQERKLNMYHAVVNFCIPNAAVTASLPGFDRCLKDLKDMISTIQLSGESQKFDNRGITIEKKKIRSNLVTLAADNSRRIAAMAKFTNNDPLLLEILFKDSDLNRMTDVALRDYCQILYNRIESEIKNLSDYGISQDTQSVLKSAIDSFNSSIATPRAGLARTSQATKQLSVLFDEADLILEKMDYAAGVVKLTNPQFFFGYRTVRKIVETGSGSLALTASARDTRTGEFVSGVSFVFHREAEYGSTNVNGSFTKKTAKKGSFNVKSMPAGTYKVEVSKPGFKNTEATVSVADGEMSELVVEMEKI
jgi:hypothetical protein